MAFVFISHAAEDEASARAVAEGLERSGRRAWLYERDALPGPSYLLQTKRAIEDAAAIILLVSGHALRSHQMTREVVRACELARPIVPVLLDVTHEDLMREQPEWAQALGASTSVRVRAGELGDVVPKIVAGLASVGLAEGTPAPAAEDRARAQAMTFADVVRDPALLLQRRIGQYLVREFLGAGGSGLVYRVHDGRLGREGCVKIFYPVATENARVGEVIAAGARALAALRHPDIVEIWDFGSTPVVGECTAFFLSMNLVRGLPLDVWSRRQSGPGAFAARLRVATRLAAALQAAHVCRHFDPVGFERIGVLHGDVKPANVLVRADGAPVLLDFMMVDLHRLLDERVVPRELLRDEGFLAPLTAAMGTAGFMAPEQASDGVVTVRTDLFGLGVSFVHLFRMDTDAASVPAALGALVGRMTALSPDERPASMAEVVEALTALGA